MVALISSVWRSDAPLAPLYYKDSPSSSLTTENTESRVRAHRGGWGVREFPPLQPLRIHLSLDGHPRASAAVLGFPLLADSPSPIRSPLRGRVGSCALQSPLFAPFIAAARSSLIRRDAPTALHPLLSRLSAHLNGFGLFGCPILLASRAIGVCKPVVFVTASSPALQPRSLIRRSGLFYPNSSAPQVGDTVRSIPSRRLAFRPLLPFPNP